ncbi:MAG: glycosyltransferase [Acidobacteria bacterium]|nr:glycosyltransferase [Acidobacteriota bacterium]
MRPTISVVTPSFNQGKYLEATILSVLDQRYEDLEYIVIDGGSTDCSVEVIREHEGEIDFWVSEPDGGHVPGLIKGFSHATGEIQCWLNSDDLFEPGALDAVGEYFAEHPDCMALYGDALWIDVQGEVIRPKKEHDFSRFIWMYDYNYIPQPSMFWRKSLYESVGGLDREYQLAFDADLWIRFADVTELHHMRRVLSRMRLYSEQRNQKYRSISDAEDLRMRRRYIGGEHLVSLKAKKAIAKAMRVSRKLALGAYWT